MTFVPLQSHKRIVWEHCIILLGGSVNEIQYGDTIFVDTNVMSFAFRLVSGIDFEGSLIKLK